MPTPVHSDNTYRDSIPTVDQRGKRVWIFPRKPPTGKRASPEAPNFYTLRTWLSWVLLVILFTGPFIKINGNPLLMMNIVERKFSLFGVMFWPQDLYLFALAMLTGMVMLVFFTAVFGRIWCGWLCPQTVLMELVFRKIEYWIDGDAGDQRALADAPWSPEKLRKRALKHGIFFALSFVVSNLLLGYVIGGDALLDLITSSPAGHAKGFLALLLFTLLFYAIFSRFREQACTFICPYGRLQSVLLDENSIVVAYDHKRGEDRSRLTRGQTWEERLGLGKGDCVDCGLCVTVCPTGIDIRNGTQMECVNCTACIDACNSVMHRIKRPPGLIRYASENNINNGEHLKWTPRLKGYTVLLAALLTVLSILMFNRSAVEADILRVPGTWYQTQPDGRITNMFNARFLNKTNHDKTGTLRLLNREGSLQFAHEVLTLPSQEEVKTVLVMSLDPSEIRGKETPVTIGLEIDGRIEDQVSTTFIAPVGGK